MQTPCADQSGCANVLKPVMTVKKVVLVDNKHMDLEMGLLGEALG